MLTDGRVRNGVINPARHWRSKLIPFVIHRVFSEYCSTKLQFGIRGVEGNIMH